MPRSPRGLAGSTPASDVLPSRDTCAIWPCTQHSGDPGVPHPAPTSPQPLGVPLPRRYFPSISSAFCARARGCPSKVGREGATTQVPPYSSCGQKPLLSSCQQPRSGLNDTGLGRRETGQEADTGSGAMLPALRSPLPSKVPSAAPRFQGLSNHTPPQDKNAGCHRLRRCERRKERVLRSGSCTEQAGAVLRSAVGPALQLVAPPFCPKESWTKGTGD